ncbi:hypothetical protein FIBSPDRAFT_1047938 [Athelia psychrophila]|uniref:Uncharacterized protein n=1 Tax=Athelia psychrophila TaxID=1759441 RepID=A0A166EFG8_9AGAM|nr:hypothetical protein FIBSPDRAFT_1047938 [Fibularhizoctonia sp. CBS 109695]
MSVRVSLPWVLASTFHLQAGQVLLAALDLCPFISQSSRQYLVPINVLPFLPYPNGGIHTPSSSDPSYGGFINQKLVPETYTPVLPKWTAARLRVSTHHERFDAPLDGNDIDVMRVVVISCYKLFQRITYDRMTLLNAWNALFLGMPYLVAQAFQFIFAEHGFNAD